MLVASDVGPQCTGCMDEEAREVQQAQKLESVKDVCSGMQCEPGSDHTVGIWVMLPYGVLPGCTLLLLLLFILGFIYDAINALFLRSDTTQCCWVLLILLGWE